MSSGKAVAEVRIHFDTQITNVPTQAGSQKTYGPHLTVRAST